MVLLQEVDNFCCRTDVAGARERLGQSFYNKRHPPLLRAADFVGVG
jgi:hypothetical protein